MPDETSPAPLEVIARWPYYTSKLYQEEAARRACGDRVELVIVNPSLLLGPGDDRLSSTRPVLQFLAREIAMVPPGGLNFVDVRDVAALLPVAMERGTPGERYLVGGYNWTFDEFFGRLERLTKVAAPLLKSRGPLPLLATRAQAAMYRHWGRRRRSSPRASRWPSTSGTSTRARRRASWASSPRDATDTLFDTVKYIRENLLSERRVREQAEAGVRAAPRGRSSSAVVTLDAATGADRDEPRWSDRRAAGRLRARRRLGDYVHVPAVRGRPTSRPDVLGRDHRPRPRPALAARSEPHAQRARHDLERRGQAAGRLAVELDGHDGVGLDRRGLELARRGAADRLELEVVAAEEARRSSSPPRGA